MIPRLQRAPGAPVGFALMIVVLAAATAALAYVGYAPLIDRATQAATIGARLAGFAGDRRYLVLAQNPAELRPQGGYTGTVGVVSLHRGYVVERSFVDVYQFDLQPGVPFVEPPPELANHLLGDASWQLADAAWSPDFPTAAQAALHAYELESGDTNIDGVIALTTYAIDGLLEVTGPITVPKYGVTVAAGEVTLLALGQTRGISTPTSDRKRFLDDLAEVVVERLNNLPPDAWPRLASALTRIEAAHDILVWMPDPAEQSLLAGRALAGEVNQEPGGYLYVVEANVAPTSKYNLVVDRTDDLAVELDADGNAAVALSLRWNNRAMQPGDPYTAIRSYSTNKNGLYGAYVRVLTPSSSRLVSVEGGGLDPITDIETDELEANRRAFGAYLLMGPGTSRLSFVWAETGSAIKDAQGAWTYRLSIQKQPGARPLPISFELRLPPGAMVESTPAGAQSQTSAITLSETLDSDLSFEVRYRLP